MSTDLESAFRVLERSMGERLGVKLQITRNPSNSEIGVTARYWAQKTTIVDEALSVPLHLLGEQLIDACIQAKLALCSHVQHELMNLGDRDETKQIVDAAYLYRLACAELQPAWERLKKCPAGSAAAECAQRDYDRLRAAADAKRATLIRIAAGGHQENVI